MNLTIFSGTANRPLGEALARALGYPLGQCHLERFPDGELHVELQEDVRGRSVCLIQPTVPPVGENLLELLLMADACWRGGAARLMAVVPYFGYARQDRRTRSGEAVGARVIADALVSAGAQRLVVVDPHTVALEAMCGVPVEMLSATPVLARALEPTIPESAVVVAPDLGAVKLAERFAALLRHPVAVVRKTRLSGARVRVEELVGEVRRRAAVIVDDMISTGGTVEAAAAAAIEAGAKPDVTVLATHGLLVGPALERLSQLPLRRLVVSDSVAQPKDLPFPAQVVSLAPLLATAIKRLHRDESMNDLIARR